MQQNIFDAIPCSWFNIYTDADEQAIKDFRTEARLSPSTANKQIFENLELFTVVFKRQNTNSANHGIVNDIVNDTINENEQAILNLLATTPGLNASEISKHINKSLRTTMRYIKVLQDKNLIEFRGAPKTGGYFLKNETYGIQE